MRRRLNIQGLLLIVVFTLYACGTKEHESKNKLPALEVADNHRFLADESNNPFFWLGDTGWLLFSKLSREDADLYLQDRAEKGFNVIQVMVLHSLDAVNVYGDSALIGSNVANPRVTNGNLFEDSIQYDYWDHVDYIVDRAADKGIYIGMVPVWGSNVKSGAVSRTDAAGYASWLSERYRGRPNIIWLNGGDVRGSDSLAIWNTIGNTINKYDTCHLITYHPFGRQTSSIWFHHEEWLDFNMFQSGHRRYDQDDTEWGFGEDNWKYVDIDYSKYPPKPTMDGEPSYEGIPQGLHDTTQPYWTDDDIRRYAYWSVFAGGCGFTYGCNAVMQFHMPGDKAAYGAREYWTAAINNPGASQMQYLKKLMLSHSYFERIPDQSLIAGENGKGYSRVIATRGKDYAMMYTYTGEHIRVQMGKINGDRVKASWYSPLDGTLTVIGEYENAGTYEFDPPGEPVGGNDWVLVLEKVY